MVYPMFCQYSSCLLSIRKRVDIKRDKSYPATNTYVEFEVGAVKKRFVCYVQISFHNLNRCIV